MKNCVLLNIFHIVVVHAEAKELALRELGKQGHNVTLNWTAIGGVYYDVVWVYHGVPSLDSLFNVTFQVKSK